MASRWVPWLGAALVALGAGAAQPERVARATDREELLRTAEAALEKRDVEGALAAFERAASLAHSADTEMGLVRAYMQRGEYRRALAFVAHTASAHRDEAGGAVLYAWLLHVGGQRAAAQRVLDEATRQFPGEPTIAEVRAQLALQESPRATGHLREAPLRLAPYGDSTLLPTDARVVASGVLIDRGRRAFVPLASVDHSDRFWVRNALGDLASARIQQRLADQGVAVLVLETPLPYNAELEIAPRPAYPGSVGFAVEHAGAPDAAPGWPLLSSGFVGRAIAGGAMRELGIDLPAGPHGGPVFDAYGRLLGMTLGGAAGGNRLVPISVLRAQIGTATDDGPPRPLATAPVDRIYEDALRTALQVIAAR